MTYSFDEQLARSKKHEKLLDAYFGQAYTIVPATAEEERTGIDRHFTSKGHPDVTFSVEYKCDEIAHRTGNAFIETVSVDRNNVPGWAYTCSADYLMYHIVEDDLVYVLEMEDIRANLETWELAYPTRTAHTVDAIGYNSSGILVPLGELEMIGYAIVLL